MIKNLSTKEVKKILDKGICGEKHTKVRDVALMRLLVNTGMRVGEMSKLLISDVLNGRGEVKDILVVRKEIAKNKQERIIPLNDAAKAAIVQLVAFNKMKGYGVGKDSNLFVSLKKSPMTIRQIQRIVKSAAVNADIDIKVSPHTFRHTFAVSVYKNSHDIRTLQKLLGHKYLATTEVYMSVSRDDLEQAVKLVNF